MRDGSQWNTGKLGIQSPSRPVLDESQWPSSRSSAASIGTSILSGSPTAQAWPAEDPDLRLEPEPEPEPEPEAAPVPSLEPPMAPPRPKMTDTDCMMIALARVHGLSTGDGVVGVDKPLGVTWSTSFDHIASRSSIRSREASNYSKSLLAHRPAGTDYFRVDQPGYLHTRCSTRQLAPWIVGAATHGKRQADVKRARERSERLRRVRSKPRLQKDVMDVGDTVWYQKMANRARREAEAQAVAAAAPRKAQDAEELRRSRSEDLAQELALEAAFRRVCALYT